jgi:uncharacterized membrane protein
VSPSLITLTGELFVCLVFALFASLCRRDRSVLAELAAASLFGLVLEIGSPALFHSYSYSSRFWLAVHGTPIVIALTWGMILVGAMQVSDALGVPRGLAVVTDATLVLLLDFAFDAVAIRMGFWTWEGVSRTSGIYGVPPGNFIGWMCIAIGFSFLTRYWARPAGRRGLRRQLAVPFVAFACEVVALVGCGLVTGLAGPAVRNERAGADTASLYLFAAGAIACTLVTGYAFARRRSGAPNTNLLIVHGASFVRIGISGVFLLFLASLPASSRLPGIVVISLVCLLIEIALAAMLLRVHPVNVRSVVASILQRARAHTPSRQI